MKTYYPYFKPRYLIRLYIIDHRVYELWRDEDGLIRIVWTKL